MKSDRLTRSEAAPPPGCVTIGRSSPGFAAIDAMVSLLIIATTIVLGLQGLRQGRDVAIAAEERRQVRVLITHVLETGASSFELAQGETNGLIWKLQTQASDLGRPISVCRRVLVVTARASGRLFSTSTRRPCPEDTGGG